MIAEHRLRALLLLGAVLAVWAGAFGGSFQFDDWNVIVEQPAVHSIAAWWTSMPGIRPLLKLSYAVDWQTGDGTYPFHLTNLLLHGANTLLVWTLVRRWPGVAAETATSVAFWAALIFALHPVQAEAVAYVSGRSMSLMAFFWLAATASWLQASPGGAARYWKALSLLLFVAALGVRETALTLPLVLWVWHRAEGDSWQTAFRRLSPMWLVMLAGIGGLLMLPRYRSLLAFSLDLRPPLANLGAQIDGLAYLLTRPLLLLQTNIDPDVAMHPVGSLFWLFGATALLALIIVGLLCLRRHPACGLALLWPFLLLLPTNSLIARLDLVADRQLYLALLGPAVMLVIGARWLSGRRGCGGAWLGLPVVVLVLAVHAHRRVDDFSTETALWRATVEHSPGKARVWNNLGYGLLQEGDPERARDAFRRALQIQPDYSRAAFNLRRAEDEIAALQDAASRR